MSLSVEAKIAALEEALATGALEVEYRSGDSIQRVKYRSLSEIEKVLAGLRRAASGIRPVTRTVGVVVVR